MDFEPLEAPFEGANIRLSQIVDIHGNTKVKFNRANMRGFDKGEIERILRVGICLNCHQEDDRVFKNWSNRKNCPKVPF